MSDDFYAYVPRPEQAEMRSLMLAHRFCVFVAHRRMGKTVAMVNYLVERAGGGKQWKMENGKSPGPKADQETGAVTSPEAVDSPFSIFHSPSSPTAPRYAYIGPYQRQTKDIAWHYLKHFTGGRQDVKYSETDLSVNFGSGARIRIYGADRPDSLRGLYLDGVVLDEVAQMRPEVWGEIVRPALADRGGWAVFIGTPKGQNSFYDLWVRAGEQPQTQCRTQSAERRADRQPQPLVQNAECNTQSGPPSSSLCTLHSALCTSSWARRLWRATETTAIPPAELEAVRAELTDGQYRQEFLCDFSAASDDVLIPLDLVEAAQRRVVQERDLAGSERVIGVDVARFGDDASVICRRWGRYCYPLAAWRGLATDTLAERVAEAIREFKPDATAIDVGGPGPGVIDLLRRWGYPVEEVHFGARAADPAKYFNKRAEMWGLARDWLRLGGRLPPEDPQLAQDLTGPRYGFADDGHQMKLEPKDKIKERGGRSPDRGDALALTFAVPVAAKGPSVLPRGDGLWTRGVFDRDTA